MFQNASNTQHDEKVHNSLPFEAVLSKVSLWSKSIAARPLIRKFLRVFRLPSLPFGLFVFKLELAKAVILVFFDFVDEEAVSGFWTGALSSSIFWFIWMFDACEHILETWYWSTCYRAGIHSIERWFSSSSKCITNKTTYSSSFCAIIQSLILVRDDFSSVVILRTSFMILISIDVPESWCCSVSNTWINGTAYNYRNLFRFYL